VAGTARNVSARDCQPQSRPDILFGDDFLLRRQDYTLDIAGGGYVANCAFDLSESNGLLIPNRRRAHLCDDNYQVLKDRLLIWIDYADIKFR
jgi:hypothetical protein